MEIRASELKEGKRIPFEHIILGEVKNRYYLLWNKRMERYEIVLRDKPSYVFWHTGDIFTAVNHMDALSHRYNTAVEDTGDWVDYTGGTVHWDNY